MKSTGKAGRTGMHRRKIRIKEAPAAVVRNCILGHTDPEWCYECPLNQASSGHCIYRIVEIAPVCEEIKDVKSGQSIFIWHFECVHCGNTAAIVTAQKSVIKSQGSCAKCEADYLYFRGEAKDLGREKVYSFAVSRPRRKLRRKEL